MPEDLKLNMNAYLPLRDVVFHTLREAILKGDLRPGERLMELQLASKLGVSRTPIREAIRMLEQEGLARADRTAGRLVTQDTAALEAVRLREAEAVIRRYLEAMSALGYSREQAAGLLKEGTS